MNFTVALDSFRWTATPNATRYELHVDPDGTGPLPETKVDDYNEASRSGFVYSFDEPQGFTGLLRGADTSFSPTARLSATYRLRACNASECGAFTDSQAFDITQGTSYGFASGYRPLRTTSDADRLDPVVSRDGLTLAIRGEGAVINLPALVFVRNSKTQPWVQQASLSAGDYAMGQFVLSADGSTLAALAMKHVLTAQGSRVVADAVYIYQRMGAVWSQQARLDTTNAPSACAQPCQAELAEHMALSADGNLLAISAAIPAANSSAASSNAVFTYTRTGTSWAPQTALDAEGPAIAGLALSDDGSTLAVTHSPLWPSAPSSILMLAQNGNGAWVQQGRIPATLAVYMPPISGGPQYGTMALSSDGSTLAVNASNLQEPTLCSGAAAASNWGVALYARANGVWLRQGQAVIANGAPSGWATWAPWALASDGNALIYGNTLFSRSNGAWACP